MTDHTLVTTEFHVRFNSETIGTGIHQSPSWSPGEAARQFVEDKDSISAMKMEFNAEGRLVSSADITEEILPEVLDILAEDVHRCTDIKKRTNASYEPKTEFYIRCHNSEYGVSTYESPCDSLSEAIGQFIDDEDSVSVLKLTTNSFGRLASASDFTEDLLFDLRESIANGEYETCPHSMVQDSFDTWQQANNLATKEQEEHDRVERSMLHV